MEATNQELHLAGRKRKNKLSVVKVDKIMSVIPPPLRDSQLVAMVTRYCQVILVLRRLMRVYVKDNNGDLGCFAPGALYVMYGKLQMQPIKNNIYMFGRPLSRDKCL